MPEHRLVRKVLQTCVDAISETLLVDIPHLDVAIANEMAKDRKLWSSYRPSLRC